jgi:hypothetical protein
VKDFYEAAAMVAVVHTDYAAMDAVASMTASLVEQVQHSNGGATVGGVEYLAQLGALVKPPLSLNEVIQRCMSSSLSDSRLSWMACNLLSDEVCSAALQLIYEDGAATAVWRPFPQHVTVRALMHCLGWLDEAVLAEKREKRRLGVDASGEREHSSRGASSLHSGDSFFGSDTAAFRGRAFSSRHRAHERRGGAPRTADRPRSIDERARMFDAEHRGGDAPTGIASACADLAERTRIFGETVARPLLQQTPWNTQKVGLLTFADAEVETQWLEARERSTLRRERVCALLILVVFGFALPADAGAAPASATWPYSPARLGPALFALAFLAGTQNGDGLFGFAPLRLSPATRQLLVCAFRVAYATASAPASFSFASRRARLAAPLFAELFLPTAFSARFSRAMPTCVACLVTTRLSFGAWTRTNDVAGFDAPAEVILRYGAVAALAAVRYVREYHDRFSFLMRFFNPGKRKVA